jgi:hypothetical protein
LSSQKIRGSLLGKKERLPRTPTNLKRLVRKRHHLRLF